MLFVAHIIGDNPSKIWGLTSYDRNLRVLKNAGVTHIVEDLATLPENSSVLLLRGDFLFDDRVINYLVQTPGTLLKISHESSDVCVAAHVTASLAIEAHRAMTEPDAAAFPDGAQITTLDQLSISFQKRLLKFDPPFVLPITPENKRNLEHRLFDGAYKGVTDCVTKWVWPRPARWVVGQCVRFGFRPNHVTVFGLFLAILAGVLFAYGWYGWGLLAGWLMTFLDTVDGKLARVTVTSSKFGHYFDHIIDLVHPPIWYVLWGLGLSQFNFGGLSRATVFWMIVAGYIGGRLVEGVFLTWLGKFGVFCWRPLDSYFRLITARRNPCLIILTAGYFAGFPDWGLFAVAVWTVATSVFLLIRLLMALKTRLTGGPIRTWFLDIDPGRRSQPLRVRLFTHRVT